jgi:hypothetical protein
LVQKVVDSLSSEHPAAEQTVAYLAAALSEVSFQLSQRLYWRVKQVELALTPLVCNYLLYNAAHFGQYRHLTQLLAEATVCDIPIDINTYIKILSNLYLDYEVKERREEYVGHVLGLLGREHSQMNAGLVAELIGQYVAASSPEEYSHHQERFTRAKKKLRHQDRLVTNDQQLVS